MKRREFITLLGGAAAWPIEAGAQQAQQKPPLVGFPNSASPDTYRFNADCLRRIGEGWVRRWPQCPHRGAVGSERL